jgi:hypothetical protein
MLITGTSDTATNQDANKSHKQLHYFPRTPNSYTL